MRAPAELGRVKVQRYSRASQDFYDACAEHAPTQVWAEFGVNRGHSTRRLLKVLDDEGTLHLFDSLQGIPEPWYLNGYDRRPEPKGMWSSDGKKHVDDPRVKWWVGWFHEVLPVDFEDQLGLVHFDCDLYSSTRDALAGIDRWVRPGTVLIFDELVGTADMNTNWREGEWKALQESGIEVEWFAGDGDFAMAGVVTATPRHGPTRSSRHE